MKSSLPITLLFLLFLAVKTTAQTLNGQQLLEKSIAYHDPEGLWGTYSGTFSIRATRPGASDRISTLWMLQSKSQFGIEIRQDGNTKFYEISKDTCHLGWNGKYPISAEVAERENLSCERAKLLRDYYSYLYGLPMKLKDPGTRIDPVVTRKTFHDKTCLVLKVQYDPDTGSDTWYFYFDPTTYALVAYQFFHDQAANDGEYILLDQEAVLGSLRLPRIRKWYMNESDEFLGADILILH